MSTTEHDVAHLQAALFDQAAQLSAPVAILTDQAQEARLMDEVSLDLYQSGGGPVSASGFGRLGLAQTAVIENPLGVPLLVGFDVAAEPGVAQLTLPPGTGASIPRPHTSLSVGVAVDVAQLASPSPVFVQRYARMLEPSRWSLSSDPATGFATDTVTVGTATSPGPNMPASTLLLQSKDTNTGVIAYGAGNLAIGSDTGVAGRLTAGQSIALNLPNANLLTFQATAAGQVLYVTGLL